MTGADLGDVRVHTGDRSVQAAEQVQARAYTLGADIHFGAGQYRPGTPEGDHLIAHELAHSVQQRQGGSPQGKLTIGSVDDAAETEADRAATAAIAQPAPERMRITQRPSGSLQRAPVGGNAFGNWDLDQVSRYGAAGLYNSVVTIRFDPDRTTVNSTEIAFIQTSQVLDAAGHSALPPDQHTKREIPNHTRVDAAYKWGFGGYTNAGATYNVTLPGSTTSVPVLEPGSCPTPYKPAVSRDYPGWATPNLTWAFETAAVAKSGRDANAVYGAVAWGFDVNASNALTSHTPVFLNRVSTSFNQSIEAWNRQATGPVADRSDPDQQKLPPLFAPSIGTVTVAPSVGALAALRSGPTTSSSTLADLPVGAQVKVTDASGYWYRVDVNTTQAGVIVNPLAKSKVDADGMLRGFVAHHLIHL